LGETHGRSDFRSRDPADHVGCRACCTRDHLSVN
jgi:hypothetical protein